MISSAMLKDIDNEINKEIEDAIRLIFRNQFTEAPKGKDEKSIEKTELKQLGYSFMGSVKVDPKTKKKTVIDNTPVRTYRSFMYYTGYSDMMFFTPNTFGRAWKRCEENLDYLNALVIDIDDCDCFVALWERYNESGIPFLPTMINKTDKGYHIYFVLEESLKAKKSNRIRYKRVLKGLIHKLGGDKAASSLVNYYRIPRSIEYKNPNNIVSFEEIESYIEKEFTNDNGKFIIPGFSTTKVLESEALISLIENGVDSHRNWTAWAIAKCCLYDGLSESDALCVLETFNSSLTNNSKGKLRLSELKSKIKSAYKKNDGRLPLDFIYQMTGLKITLNKKWIKHKKERSDRKLVHMHEWMSDLLLYLKANGNHFEGSQKALATALSAPERSIKKLIKELKEGKFEELKHELIIKTIGIGRNAKTVIVLKESESKNDGEKVIDYLEYRNKMKKPVISTEQGVLNKVEETVQDANKKGKGEGGRSPTGDVVTLPHLSSRMPVELVDPRGKPEGFST